MNFICDEVTISQSLGLHHINYLLSLIICQVCIEFKNYESMKIKESIIISVIFCFMTVTSVAQSTNKIKLRGIVKDANTETPLPFAHIEIRNKAVGTVTNKNGEFVFLFDKSLIEEDIVISFIGYKPYVISVYDMINLTQKILLEPTTLYLNEVEISQLSAKSTVKKAIFKIPDNYWKSPIILRGFYRETIKENENYTEYAEGVIDIYKNPNGSSNEDKVRLVKGRRRNDLSSYEVSKNAVVTIGGPVFCNYYDRIRYLPSFLDTNQFNLYDFRFETSVVFNDKAVSVISFDQIDGLKKSLRKGKLFIDKQTFAILRIEYGYSPKGMKYELPNGMIRGMMKLFAGISIEDERLNIVIDYQQVNNYWCLKSIYYKNEQVIAKKKDRKYIITIQKNLIVNQISDKNSIPFTEAESLSSKEFKKQLGDYDEDFWAGYNYLKAPEDMSKIINKTSNIN